MLGPILFLLYINDLNKCIKYSDTFHFADDTNLLNIIKDYKTQQNNVNRDLRSLNEWLLANKILLNKDKTELIYFHKARSKVPTNLKIKMNGKKLYHSTKIKYLGIYLKRTNFRMYLFSRAKKNRISPVFIFANDKFLKISRVKIFENSQKVRKMQVFHSMDYIIICILVDKERDKS